MKFIFFILSTVKKSLKSKVFEEVLIILKIKDFFNRNLARYLLIYIFKKYKERVTDYEITAYQASGV